MSVEYHGWIALATSREDWDDGDLAEAYERVRRVLPLLNPEEGHWAIMTDAAVLPRMVYLNGFDVDSLDAPKKLVKEIAAVFDRAYGEVGALEMPSLSAPWTPSSVDRYAVVDGKLARV